LFLSLTNSDQRARAQQLWCSLPAKIAGQVGYLRVAIFLHFRRGDYSAAGSAVKKLLALKPDDLHTHLKQVDLWLRGRNHGEKEVRTFLQGDVERLQGDPEEVMRLAHLLDRFRYYERALKLG